MDIITVLMLSIHGTITLISYRYIIRHIAAICLFAKANVDGVVNKDISSEVMSIFKWILVFIAVGGITIIAMKQNIEYKISDKYPATSIDYIYTDKDGNVSITKADPISYIALDINGDRILEARTPNIVLRNSEANNLTIHIIGDDEPPRMEIYEFRVILWFPDLRKLDLYVPERCIPLFENVY